MIRLVALMFALAAASMTAAPPVAAQSCMVAPVDSKRVTGRFGRFRNGDVQSAAMHAHMHSGLDFSTNRTNSPLYATSDGELAYKYYSQSLGNVVIIKRPNGHFVHYSHLKSLPKIKVGDQVKAGQQIAISGRTPGDKVAHHLHFVYGVPDKSDVRAKAFVKNQDKQPFNPGQLKSVFNNNQRGAYFWKTDPSPYFCETFPIDDGWPGLVSILGDDTKEQYERLFGSVPPGGVPPNLEFDTNQVIAANAVVAQANAQGQTATEFLGDGQTFGALPEPPYGDYTAMSTVEKMMTEAARRFGDKEWSKDLTKVSKRALLVDYLRLRGTEVWLMKETQKKRQNIEALLATYSSQQMDALTDQVKSTVDKANMQNVKNQSP